MSNSQSIQHGLGKGNESESNGTLRLETWKTKPFFCFYFSFSNVISLLIRLCAQVHLSP